MRKVEAGNGAVGPQVIDVLGAADEEAATDLAADVARSGDRLRPRVSSEERQARRYTPLGFHLQGMINRVTDRFVAVTAEERLVRPTGIQDASPGCADKRRSGDSDRRR